MRSLKSAHLFNHVLGSIDPEDGRTCYMVPVGRGVRHEYQDMFRAFTCCVGSGMESHGLHGDGIYYEATTELWVNLYVPSTANWKTEGVKLSMETNFPEGDTATLKLTVEKPKSVHNFASSSVMGRIRVPGKSKRQAND